MNYNKSRKYNDPALQAKMMGPNPIKLEEELLKPIEQFLDAYYDSYAGLHLQTKKFMKEI